MYSTAAAATGATVMDTTAIFHPATPNGIITESAATSVVVYAIWLAIIAEECFLSATRPSTLPLTACMMQMNEYAPIAARAVSSSG